MENPFRLSVQRIFNNWTGLRLAVEHGMGGRNGHKTAIEIMDYMYEYCVRNASVTQSELQEVLEDMMDQEFNTLCEDNSISEICFHLVKFLQLCRTNNADGIQLELNKLPNVTPWLQPDVKITFQRVDDDSSSSSDVDDDDDDESMDLDEPAPETSRASRQRDSQQPEGDPGWTVVTKKRK